MLKCALSFLPPSFLQKHARLDRSPRLLGSRLLSRLRSPTSTLSQGRGRGSPYNGAPGGTRSFQQQQSSHNLVLEPLGEPRRGRGRGVRLRGGGAGRGIVRGRGHGDLEEESEDSSSSSTSSSSSSDDEAEETVQSNGKGLDKENQPDLRQGRATKDGEEEKTEVGNQNSGEEEEEEEMETQTGGKDGSYYKVTLQKPSRAKRDPSAIVPKLEAVTPQTATTTLHNQTRALSRPPIRDRGPCSDQHSNRHRPSHTHSDHTVQRSSRPERVETSKKTKPSRTSKLGNTGSSSSASELCHPRVPLSALQEGGSEADRENGGAGPACEREVWVSVFRYLSRADLCVCMAVCKNWYKW